MKLEIARTNPSDAASLLYPGNPKGIIGQLQGDVLMVEKCHDVSSDVWLRPTQECYFDLPIYYQEAEKFLSPSTKVILDESSIVSCQTEPSIHSVGTEYYAQNPNYSSFNYTVTVLKPQEINHTIFEDKLPYHLGNLFGDAANKFGTSMLTSVKRRTADRRATNAVLAANPNSDTVFTTEASKWFPTLSSLKLESIKKVIERTLSLWFMGTFYSVLAIIIGIWIVAIICKCIINGFTSRETWLTILSLFLAIYNFFRFFCVFFRLIHANPHAPTAPNYYDA